ncbi:unannotated protein [freshwater metagenome]|uniref:Unannotated protein n=1 Tax=freshwater metagenome TaxID=449393 RepID=A0A6J6M4I6_9ZZZZ
MAKPPLLLGADQFNVMRPADGTTTSKFEGAEANPRGVTATASLAVPAPTLVTARTRNSYAVPFARRVPFSNCVTKADVDDEKVFAIASTHPAVVFT